MIPWGASARTCVPRRMPRLCREVVAPWPKRQNPGKSPAPSANHDFLEAAGIARQVADYRAATVIFPQGDEGSSVMFIEKGTVKLTSCHGRGRRPLSESHERGDFLGEGCLAGQTRRMATATALTPTTTLVVAMNARWRRASTTTQHSLTVSCPTCSRGTSGYLEEGLIHLNSSTRARSGWRGRSCCSPATASMTRRRASFRNSRRKSSRKWWAPPDRE